MEEEKKYFVLVNNEQNGPFTLKQVLETQKVNRETLIWYDGLSEWKPAKLIGDFDDYLKTITPPPPPVAKESPQPKPNAQSVEKPFEQAKGGTGNPQTSNYGQPHSVAQAPKNYMVFALISTLIFCLPFGAISLYHSFQVNKFNKLGNLHAAFYHSGQAKKWAIVSLICAILLWWAVAALNL